MCSKRLVIDSMVSFLVESPSSLVLVETFHVASSLSPRLVRQYAGLVFFSGVKTIDTIHGLSRAKSNNAWRSTLEMKLVILGCV